MRLVKCDAGNELGVFSATIIALVPPRASLSWQGVMHARAAWFTVTRLVLVAKATSATVTSPASLTSPSRSLGPRRFFDQCCDVARVDYIVGLWQVLQQAVKVIVTLLRSICICLGEAKWNAVPGRQCPCRRHIFVLLMMMLGRQRVRDTCVIRISDSRLFDRL